MLKFSFYFFVFLMASAPFAQADLAQAAVKIGAGEMKTYQSATPSPEKKKEQQDNAAMEKAVEQKKELVPLAENVANMFRGDVEALRDSLIKRALKRLPPKARADRRDAFARYINVDQLLSLYTQTLIKYFNKKELKALRTFMADDTGRAVLNKLPTVLSQMRLKQQNYLQNTLQDILKKDVLEKVKKGEPSLLAP